MRNLLLTMLICVFSTACNKSQKKITSSAAKSDTVFLKGNEVIFISPGDKSVEKLKKKYGEDFYTIADDANNYFYEASVYLDSLKVPYKNYDDGKTVVFKKDNKTVEIPKYKSPWYLIFYKDGKYETLDLIDVRLAFPKFFSHHMSTNSGVLDSKNITDSVAGKNYFVVEEKDCDLNSDSFTDKIIVLGNNRDIDPQDPDTRIAPVLVLLNDQNKKYTILKNENIYPNNFGDSFRKLVVKNQYFTIELSNEVPDQYISEKYITFRFNEKSNEVVLSKYGENIDWGNGRKDNKLCAEKNFGKILFQAYSSNDISAKCDQ